nr:hypothetical protein MFLOJ_53580 [Mycobacterium florentinum]
MAAATACGGASSFFGGAITPTFLGAPGACGLIFGVCTGVGAGRVEVGGRGSGGGSGMYTGVLVGAGAGRGAGALHTFAV